MHNHPLRTVGNSCIGIAETLYHTQAFQCICLTLLRSFVGCSCPQIKAQLIQINSLQQIMDSFCAEDGHHIGVVKGNLNTSRQGCTVTCVKLGGAKFVLYNPNSKRVYKLDNQEQPEAFAGQKVIVTGTYDQETTTIRVTRIRPVVAEGL